MSGKDNFKQFVRKNPSLVSYVKSGDMTWQKFYEMYDLYGENSDIWKNYLEFSSNTISSFDILNWLKNIDVDALQENINSVKRVIGVLQDLGEKNNNNNSSYRPRPLYRHFED